MDDICSFETNPIEPSIGLDLNSSIASGGPEDQQNIGYFSPWNLAGQARASAVASHQHRRQQQAVAPPRQQQFTTTTSSSEEVELICRNFSISFGEDEEGHTDLGISCAGGFWYSGNANTCNVDTHKNSDINSARTHTLSAAPRCGSVFRSPSSELTPSANMDVDYDSDYHPPYAVKKSSSQNSINSFNSRTKRRPERFGTYYCDDDSSDDGEGLNPPSQVYPPLIMGDVFKHTGTSKKRTIGGGLENTHRGVTMRPSGKWQSQLYFQGKSRYIGVFNDMDTALRAYNIVKGILFVNNYIDGPKDTLTPHQRRVGDEMVREAKAAAKKEIFGCFR